MSNINNVKSAKKNFYKDFFSKQDQVEKWHNLYQNNSIWASSINKRLSKIIDWLPENSSLKKSIILDLGCGAGVTSNALESLNYKIVGVDQALAMVERAKINSQSANTAIDFLQGDVETLPFKAGSIDIIVCLGVISYLNSAQKTITEIDRVLKPDGIFILSFHGKIILREFILWFNRKFRSIFSSTNNEKNKFRRRRYSLAQIKQIFINNNIKPVTYEVIDYNYLTLACRKLISTRLAFILNRYLLKLSHKFPLDKFGDMYLIKAKKEDSKYS